VVARHLRGLLVLLFGLAVLLPAVPALAQAAPGNDDFSNTTTIGALPFSDNADTTAATSAPDDPTACANNGSVWYAITPSQNENIIASTFGSSYDTVLSVYTGTRGALALVTCNDDSSGTLQSQVSFAATTGTTYFVMIGQCCGSGGSGGGQLTFDVSAPAAPAPPGNDNFSNATPIPALPFSDTIDTTVATVEPGEPVPSCDGSSPPAGSAWYGFTATASGSVSASASSSFFNEVAAYTGTSVGHLAPVGCGTSGTGLTTIHVDAGTAYYFQVAGAGQRGPLTFSIDVAPAPDAAFFVQPSDPSIFDRLQFFDESSDPGRVGIQSLAWNFGDGTTGTGPLPTHQYAADGDYSAVLTVTTTDGRTGSETQIMHVSTHDVAITAFTVPASARPGKTGTITVRVGNKRYPETVQVQLLKGNTQGGFDVVGTMTLPVPVQSGKHTIQFAFSYTFTQSDATLGKATFEAIATIEGRRDAIQEDNMSIATTKVR
jgi:hypothetical protein